MQHMPLGQILLASRGLTSGNAAKLGRGLLENFFNHPKHDTSALNLLVKWNLVLLGLAE